MTPALVIFALIATTAAAQNLDAIKARQTILKSFGDETKPLGLMLRGQQAFDLAAVKTALTTIADGAKKLPALFPDDSKTGNDTQALPEIWTNKADFEARYAKLSADATADLSGITDAASFKAEFPKLAGECGGCHRLYRQKT
jgi:cytochrome c556